MTDPRASQTDPESQQKQPRLRMRGGGIIRTSPLSLHVHISPTDDVLCS